MRTIRFLLALAAICLATGHAAAAALPRELTWVTQTTSSAAYAQTVAIGKMLKKVHGTRLTVLREASSVARLAALRDGRASFCVCGSDAYFAQEGVLAFAAPAFGPQPVSVVAVAQNSYNFALATAADAGIRKPGDLKGRRLSWLRGRDAVNWSSGAYLAFADLSWGDVKAVETDTYKASVDAVINGLSDAVLVATFSPYVQMLKRSPRGLTWLALPHDDTAAWRRLMAHHPLARKNVAPDGFGIDPVKGLPGFSQDYPVLIAATDTATDTVHAVLEAMMEHHQLFAMMAPGAQGWSAAGQSPLQPWPQHPGAIRYWQDQGRWDAAAAAHHDLLSQRQRTLAKAWQAFASQPAADRSWAEAREKALLADGQEPVFRTTGLR
jgi:TRAP transporter TAXI family solute receptor